MRLTPLTALVCLILAALPVAAQDDKPVLQVTGLNSDAPARLTIADLRALPATTFSTSTVVTDATHRFTGVLLRDLLGHLNIKGKMVTATALNDYVIDIPMSDFESFDVIIAYSMDGRALERADKGPLWIVYPRDAHKKLQDIRYDYRWVWQLSEIKVR